MQRKDTKLDFMGQEIYVVGGHVKLVGQSGISKGIRNSTRITRMLRINTDFC